MNFPLQIPGENLVAASISVPWRLLTTPTAIIFIISGFALQAIAQDKLDTAKIDQVTGLSGKPNKEEGVFKIIVPRDDIKINIAGVKMTPASGLMSWAAFQNGRGQTMVMGDIVLLEEQVNPVNECGAA
jgi:hypothetical protein